MHIERIPLLVYVAIAGLLVGFQALLLILMGQPLLCECGYVKLWHGVILSGENSQQIFDWYTFSHIAHGFIFYWLLSIFAPRMPWGGKLLVVLAIEIGWEILENTPMIINYYRGQALAAGYTGDSIINSISDTLSMVGGFLLATKLPTKYIILIAIIMEVFTILMVRDSLLLNLANFVAPLDFIQEWQVSGN